MRNSLGEDSEILVWMAKKNGKKCVLANWEVWNWWLQSHMKNKRLMTAKSQEKTNTWWLQIHMENQIFDVWNLTISKAVAQQRHHYLRLLVHYRCFMPNSALSIQWKEMTLQSITCHDICTDHFTALKPSWISKYHFKTRHKNLPNIMPKHIFQIVICIFAC